MKAKATTVRLDDNLQTALTRLSKFVHRPMNSLINEAVEVYLNQKVPAVEKEMESTLAALTAYRKRDPGFAHAIKSFVDSELKHDDPLEGRVVRKNARTKKSKKTTEDVRAHA